MRATLKGVSEIQAKLKKFESDLQGALGGALKASATDIIDNSSERAPYLTGNLADVSRKVEDPEYGMRKVSVAAGYDGAIADYAIAVHERTSVYHPSGEAKFLENAIDEVSPGIAKKVAAALRAALGT